MYFSIFLTSSMSDQSADTPSYADDLSNKPFGWTCFDAMSREELIEQCQRMYMATTSLAHVARMARLGNEQSPYWTAGVGARAVEQGEQALAAALKGHNPEDAYDLFYRYAGDLLFKDKPNMTLHTYWNVCSACGVMHGTYDKFDEMVGKTHKEATGYSTCDGLIRLLRWEDLRPQTPATEPAEDNGPPACETNASVGYYPSMTRIVRDNLTYARDWSSPAMLYLAQEFMQKVPGFVEVDLRARSATGSVQLDLLEAIPDAMSKSLQVIYQELDSLAVSAVKEANLWLKRVLDAYAGLRNSLVQREASRSYDAKVYDYDRNKYPTLVHQLAHQLLQANNPALLDVRGYHEPLPLAVGLLVEDWEYFTEKDASDYDNPLA